MLNQMAQHTLCGLRRNIYIITIFFRVATRSGVSFQGKSCTSLDTIRKLSPLTTRSRRIPLPQAQMVEGPDYQEAFFTPGISPLYASSRKHTRQMPYFFRTECGLPQILHLVYALVENFGAFCCFNFIDNLAIFSSDYFANGMLNSLRSSLASSSVFAVVTKITSIPLTLSTLSNSISGKMICSLRPSA